MRAWGGNLSPGAGNQRCPAPAKSGNGGESGAMWSMTSLMEALPQSPSPICSSSSSPRTSSVATTADFCTASHISSEFFTPRDQNGVITKGRELLHFLRSDSDFNCSKESWKQQEGNSSTRRRSMSTLYESAYATTMEQQKLQYQELICEATSSSGKETPMLEGHYRLTRPRPYREFLDEVQTRQHGAEIEAWKKAQQLKLQNKLRRKEAAITNWEKEQKNKARAEVELVERKMERKREKALKKMQQKIVKVNKAAEMKRDRERRVALKKMAKVAKFSERIHTTKCVIRLKLRNWC